MRHALGLVVGGGTYVPPLALQGSILRPWVTRPPAPGCLAEVLALVRAGQTDQEIARRPGKAHTTVKTEVREILRRLGVPNRTAAAP